MHSRISLWSYIGIHICRELGSGGDSGKDGEHVQAATAIDDLLIFLMDEDPDIPVLVVEASEGERNTVDPGLRGRVRTDEVIFLVSIETPLLP